MGNLAVEVYIVLSFYLGDVWLAAAYAGLVQNLYLMHGLVLRPSLRVLLLKSVRWCLATRSQVNRGLINIGDF